MLRRGFVWQRDAVRDGLSQPLCSRAAALRESLFHPKPTSLFTT